MFTAEQIIQIIAYLFPNLFFRCDAPVGQGCIPGEALGL